ncbi:MULTISPECIES: pyroglutamyl-peptidase I [Paenibacillus]|uniref:pyroglutamyl-peptidase I n=1 Tax=Paenibacillus TaxID=44249 RepID=UPI001F21B227|nr:pyroglutamyl-peptidase I [Paenibacillus sp. JJ-223]CAH1198837.1 Pyrrolidone-carboxylate peptidase [Paenibacillus sp. JJ-223]
MSRTILLTGFEPFGGDAINPAQKVLEWFEGRSIEGYSIYAKELPTVFGSSIEQLYEAIDEIKPELVICLGLAAGRPDITVERIAINVDDARIPDNEGNQPPGQPIFPDGPAAYWSTLPIKAMVNAMNEQGIPASVSNTAGTFVCNHVFYGLMHKLEPCGGRVRGGFIHIPMLPEQAVSRSGPSMGMEMILKGVEAGIRAAILHPSDIVAAHGQIC